MRSRLRHASLVGLVLALCLSVSGVATAHDSHKGKRRHKRHHDHYRDAPRYYHGDDYSHRYRRGREHREQAYYCAACRHRFGSRRSFDHHLHYTHHIPIWRIPFVIVHGVMHGIFGWIFHG